MGWGEGGVFSCKGGGRGSFVSRWVRWEVGRFLFDRSF